MLSKSSGVLDTLYIEKPSPDAQATPQDLMAAADVNWFKDLETTWNLYRPFQQKFAGKIREWRERPQAEALTSSSAVIQVSDFSSSHLYLNVEALSSGYVYLNEGWSRYWKAYDSGHEVPVEIANYAFKAVHLEEGHHDLRFEFQPQFFLMAAKLYCLSVVILFVVLLVSLKANLSSPPRTLMN